MRTYSAETLTELNGMLCREIVRAPRSMLDVITSVDVQIHNVIAECDRMEWTFDMKDLWLTPSRWSMMVKQYLEPQEVEAWLERSASTIGLRGRGIAVLRTRLVAARGGPAQGNKETRRWGSCMLACSYKAKPRPQITLYSRTSYLGYLGALDLSIAWMLGRYLAQAIGCKVEDFAFVWMNEALQYHHFKSLAYLLNHPHEPSRDVYRLAIMGSDKKLGKKKNQKVHDLVENSPALIGSRKWMQKLMAEDKAGKTLGDMTYNTYRRIRRRYHTEVHGIDYARQFEGWSYYKQDTGEHKKGDQKEFFKAYVPLPSTPIETRDFSAIRLPLTGVAGVAYHGDDGYDDDEED